ncbi:MAG: hypothetical protein PHP74_04265 [Candidatus Gracilibacteria bacterium]|nr:hypothetical protein [Candidatus Gracilibacteria bacterium]
MAGEGSFGGGGNPFGSGNESFSPDNDFLNRPMSIPSNLNEGRDNIKEFSAEQRMIESDIVASKLMVSFDRVKRAYGVEGYSEEMSYEDYVHSIVIDTLDQNGKFSKDQVYKLYSNPRLREIYSRVIELKNKKNENSKKEINELMIEVKGIVEGYSMVFKRTSFLNVLSIKGISELIRNVRNHAVRQNRGVEFDAEIGKAQNDKERLLVLKKFAGDDPELIKELQGQEEDLLEVDVEKKKEEDEAAAIKKTQEEAAKKKAEEEAQKTMDSVSKATDKNTSNNVYAYDQARSAMINSGVSYTLSSDGTLALGKDLNVKVGVDKDGKYFLIDEEYAEGGKVGPFNLEEFAVKAYERFIDGYISRNIRGRLKNPDEISGIPDKYLVTVGKSLLGRGDKNGYKVEGEDLKVLDKLVESLLTEDKKYPNLANKIYALYDKMRGSMDSKTLSLTEEANNIRKRLLKGESSSGKKYSVSELLGEDKSEG